MTVTTLNVSLSAKLQTEVKGKAGVWVYAAYVATDGKTLVYSTLVNNGTILNNGTTPIALPSTYDSGKVYLIIQSQDPTKATSLPSVVKTQSQLDWNSAKQYDFRFDSFEVTLKGQSGDAGNLTSVNGFGIPMEIKVPYSNGTTATASYGITGNAVVADIKAINTSDTYAYNYTAGPLAGHFRMALSPAGADAAKVTPSPFLPSDWTKYIESLEGDAAKDVILTGQFNGAPDASFVWHNGGYYAYQLQWDATNKNFWLVPLAASAIKGSIKISATDLQNSIYATNGTAYIMSGTPSAPGTQFTSINTGANNQWGAILAQLVTGFDAGYYGRHGVSLNSQITATTDLNHNNNWDPTYAFDQHTAGAAPTYQAYDPYGRIFYESTNSYGFGYSDALMSHYTTGGPLISVYDAGTTSKNVATIDLTLFADDETPTGYTKPVIYNYIAPNNGVYDVPAPANSGNSIVLAFPSAVEHSAGVILDKTATVKFSILTSDAGSKPTWSTVTLDGSKAGAYGLWQIWNISYNAQTKTYSAAVSPNTPQAVGSLLLDQLPVPTSGVTWYQIQVGDKTYNLYAKTAGGHFQNPAHAGQEGALAIDGLAITTPPNVAGTPATVPTFTVVMGVGNTVTYDPAVVVPNYDGIKVMTPPFAPVAGKLSGATFTALPNQNNPVSNNIATTETSVAFGWTGLNPLAKTGKSDQWMASYTNKVDPLTVVRVTIKPSTGTAITTTATANLDGAWVTKAVPLSIGTYTVTMQDYLASDTTFSRPLTPTSEVLTMQVLDGQFPLCLLAGTPIDTPNGPVRVEDLRPGDLVLTQLAAEPQPVLWIGHRRVDAKAYPDPRRVWPVRIAAHAFGPGLPAQAVFLSPDHAVFVDDVLIPVKYLCNGDTIRPDPQDDFTYYHVELAQHDVLSAHGLPVESYLDTGDRSNFTNGGIPARLHPDFATIRREGLGCAPLVVTGPELDAVRRRLAKLCPQRHAA